jgi:hypothetical protein
MNSYFSLIRSYISNRKNLGTGMGMGKKNIPDTLPNLPEFFGFLSDTQPETRYI